MHNGKTLTVVMPAYNEEANIAAAVEAFRALPEVDIVLVVNNNSRDRTAVEARRAGARVILETQQGYGYACRRGLLEADTDLVAIVEPDGTFRATDLYKFLAYIHEFDAVFDGPCLSDVGCTFKMFTREAIAAVKHYFTVGQSHFSPELMILCIRRKLRCVEIPVHYGPRIGESKITGDMRKAIRLGLVMTGLIGKYRFKRILPLRLPPAKAIEKHVWDCPRGSDAVSLRRRTDQ
jgi:glycosyltransferase involved in cell wall biosynthesis